ncbi:MAG: hypothetical protein ABIO44_13015 [Saprospiraceae bacterium]
MWVWKSRAEIDTHEWDLYLNHSLEPFVEFHSWYLDICCEHWGAFFNLKDNSRISIPFVKKLYFIKAVTRPPYVQRLKIISDQIVEEYAIVELFKIIKSNFKCGTLNWNYHFLNSKIRANYIIQDKKPLFNQSTNRNLGKSIREALSYRTTKNSNELIDWLQTNGENYVYKKDFNNDLFKALINKLLELENGFLILSENSLGKIQSAAIFTQSARRIVFFLSFNSQSGKKNGAMVGLLNYVINEIMQPRQELDLEGSDIPGVALFYESLGAKKFPYFELTWNESIICKLITFIKKFIN